MTQVRTSEPFLRWSGARKLDRRHTTGNGAPTASGTFAARSFARRIATRLGSRWRRGAARRRADQFFRREQAARQLRHRHVATLAGALQHLVGSAFADRVALHENSLSTLDDFAILESLAQIIGLVPLLHPFLVTRFGDRDGRAQLGSRYRLDQIMKHRKRRRLTERLRVAVCRDDNDGHRAVAVYAFRRFQAR